VLLGVLLGRHVPDCAGGPRSAEGDRPRDARDRSTGPTPAVVDDQRLQGDCGGEVRPGQRPIRSGGGHPRDHRRILPATPGAFAARRGTPTRQPRHVAHLEGWIGLAAPRSRSVVGARRTSRKPASGLRVWDSVRVPRWTPRAARVLKWGNSVDAGTIHARGAERGWDSGPVTGGSPMPGGSHSPWQSGPHAVTELSRSANAAGANRPGQRRRGDASPGGLGVGHQGVLGITDWGELRERGSGRPA